MGRHRKGLRYRLEGKQYVVRYLNPLTGLARRLVVGRDSTSADTALGWLNRIFADASAWQSKPDDVPEEFWLLWTDGKSARVQRPFENDAVQEALIQQMQETIDARDLRIKELEKEIVFWKGKRTRSGPVAKLADAAADWLAKYKCKDKQHARNVRCEVNRFVKLSGGNSVDVDYFSHHESRVTEYLNGLDVSPGRRNQIRDIVLRFLEDSGASFDRTKIARSSKKAVRISRGPIRWLEREQAEAVAWMMPEYWDDLWRTQVALGLRPSELITLCRANFSGDLSTVTLEELDEHTLKTGTRTLQVPLPIRDIVKRRSQLNDILFPQLNYRRTKFEGKPWHDEAWFYKKYRRTLRNAVADVNWMIDEFLRDENGALLEAGDELKIRILVDARTGRRTSGSLLLRAGASLEAVAAFLGDDIRTVKEHYAALLSEELDPKAAAV